VAITALATRNSDIGRSEMAVRLTHIHDSIESTTRSMLQEISRLMADFSTESNTALKQEA